ncbi:MAG: delta-60 repeat domain-containing protein [Propionibacteriaceae bacterium]|jgi:hypothetical protein|nr:delta-60 repeat domain-containing protein [Propionibacteriaceae bacterium]
MVSSKVHKTVGMVCAATLTAALLVADSQQQLPGASALTPAVIEDVEFAAELGTGFNGNVYAIAEEPQAGIYVGGDFTSVNGVPAPGLARLRINAATGLWEPDAAFSAALGSGFNQSVMALAVENDGDLLVGGQFTSFNEKPVGYIVKLRPDGVQEPLFTTAVGSGFSDFVNAIDIDETTGDILVGGDFTKFNGQVAYELARLSHDGEFNKDFSAKLGTGIFDGDDGGVMSLVVDQHGKIVVAGSITSKGCALRGISRIKPDGSLDFAFLNNAGCASSGFNYKTFSVALTVDGSTAYDEDLHSKLENGYVIGGRFTNFNGNYAGRVARFNEDGTFDKDFNKNLGSGVSGAGGAKVEVVSVNPLNGDIVVGGSFTKVRSVASANIARLNPDGTPDTSFSNSLQRGGIADPSSGGTYVNSIIFAGDNRKTPDAPSTEAMVVGGLFTRVNGVLANKLARLWREIDSDGDQLPDRQEISEYGTDPNKADTDEDGWDDYKELLEGTYQLVPDTDGDGLIDSQDPDPRGNVGLTSSVPTIVGKPKVGTQLSVNIGTWGPGTVRMRYRWFLDDLHQPIEGASNQFLTVRSEYVGHTIAVVVIGCQDGRPCRGRKAVPTEEVGIGELTPSQPTIIGTAKVGAVLKAVAGTWSPDPVQLSYQWYRNEQPIPGANTEGYLVVTADAGTRLCVKVTGRRARYLTSVTHSSSTVKVAGAALRADTPKITGTAKVGKRLQVKLGHWSPVKPRFSYQWYRNGKPIKGATKASYRPTKRDQGKQIKVRVTGKALGYSTLTKTSKAVKVKKR